MNAATAPRIDPRTTRLLRIDPQRDVFVDGFVGELSRVLHPGDLLVVNDAATLPASLQGVTESGAPIEIRLAGSQPDGSWRAVLFGAGDWRTRTERRPPPPRLGVGAELHFIGLRATITAIDAVTPRLITLRFDAHDSDLWRALYRAGRPVQYSYTTQPLALWDVQTVYSGRPWAVEPPSAGLPLTSDLLLELRRQGVGIARVTHAAGLSSTGDAGLDARLPLAERYEVPQATVHAVESAWARRGRVIAVGTSVTRALESAAAAGAGRLVESQGSTDLVLGPGSLLHVVDGIVTGVHEADTSHYRLLETFAPRALLDRAHAFASLHGYQGHEFGDGILLLPEPSAANAAIPHACRVDVVREPTVCS
jgi:S-adenosylmethionine:tRNA ribosyltransferase-isomerase